MTKQDTPIVADLISNLINASNEWHDVDDCRIEGRHDCRLCAAIKTAQKASIQPVTDSMTTPADEISSLITGIPHAAEKLAGEITALQSRIAELKTKPRAEGTIWEKPSTAKSRLDDPNYTAYYITHRKTSPYWENGQDQPRHERIGVGPGALSDAQQRVADQVEYVEKIKRLRVCQEKMAKSINAVRGVYHYLGSNQPDGGYFRQSLYW